MNLFNLKGKRALITGGTHGLGMAMAEGLASAGAELVITGTTPSKMKEALDYYTSKGFKASGYLFDVTNEIAAAENVALIDLNVMTAKFYDALGEEKSKKALVKNPSSLPSLERT